jgi:hypothetical protein
MALSKCAVPNLSQAQLAPASSGAFDPVSGFYPGRRRQKSVAEIDAVLIFARPEVRKMGVEGQINPVLQRR